MNIPTVIALIAVFACVFFALRYIIKEKRRGSKCIGCPYAEGCSKGKDPMSVEASIDAVIEQCKGIAGQSR